MAAYAAINRGNTRDSTALDTKTPKWHFMELNGNRKGPANLEQMAAAMRTKEVDMNCWCWNEGFAAWKPIWQVDEVCNFMKAQRV